MIRPIFPLLAICLLAPALSQASEKDPLEIAYEKAQTVLEDRSFYEKWKDAKTFRDAKEADGVAEAARAELRELERAMTAASRRDATSRTTGAAKSIRSSSR